MGLLQDLGGNLRIEADSRSAAVAIDRRAVIDAGGRDGTGTRAESKPERAESAGEC